MKLLVIEDDAKVARALARGLGAEGFSVEIAGDGVDGAWLAREGQFDLIVLDLMLPGRNGYQVCADLRAAGDWTPILVLTAKSGAFDETEALDTGADDYLVKPFSFPVLVARVHALLRRAETRGPLDQVVGSLRIDPRARRVWAGGTEVALTAREFDVVALLARRAGQVLSKDDLLAGVWPSDFAGDPNVVEVYIARLRRKLGAAATATATAPAPVPVIETVRGAGYRLAVEDG